jgi:hypothetical protein
MTTATRCSTRKPTPTRSERQSATGKKVGAAHAGGRGAVAANPYPTEEGSATQGYRSNRNPATRFLLYPAGRARMGRADASWPALTSPARAVGVGRRRRTAQAQRARALGVTRPAEGQLWASTAGGGLQRGTGPEEEEAISPRGGPERRGRGAGGLSGCFRSPGFPTRTFQASSTETSNDHS